MITDPQCPVCGSQGWTVLGSKTFLPPGTGTGSIYDHLRLRVLFEVWCPGSAQFRLSFQACMTCGLMIYSPRPSAADLDAKYRFLGMLPQQTSGNPVPEAADKWRAQKLFRLLNPLLQHGGRRP